jgi:hypothetical protein
VMGIRPKLCKSVQVMGITSIPLEKNYLARWGSERTEEQNDDVPRPEEETNGVPAHRRTAAAPHVDKRRPGCSGWRCRRTAPGLLPRAMQVDQRWPGCSGAQWPSSRATARVLRGSQKRRLRERMTLIFTFFIGYLTILVIYMIK